MSLEERLRRELAERAEEVSASDDAWIRIDHRLARGGGVSGRVLAAALVLGLAGAAFAGLWVAFSPLGGRQDQRPGGEVPAAAPHVTAFVDANIRVGQVPADITVSEDAVWVSLRHGSQDLLIRVDSATDEVEASLIVPEVPLYLSAGDGRVWAAWTEGIVPNESHAVVSVDPSTGRVRPVVPGIRGPLAVGWGSVWAIEGETEAGTISLVRLDQTSGEVTARIPLPMAPWHITIGDEAVWILPLEGGNSLIKVDPSTNEVAATIDVPEEGFVGAPVAGGGKLWVPVGRADGTQAIMSLDEDTLEFGRAVVVQGSAPFGFSLGRVWILDEEGAVHGLNVSTFEVDVTVSFDQPPAQTAIEPTAVLDPEGDTIWVAKYHDEIARIELRAGS